MCISFRKKNLGSKKFEDCNVDACKVFLKSDVSDAYNIIVKMYLCK